MAENEKLEQAAQAGSDKVKKDKKADKKACLLYTSDAADDGCSV